MLLNNMRLVWTILEMVPEEACEYQNRLPEGSLFCMMMSAYCLQLFAQDGVGLVAAEDYYLSVAEDFAHTLCGISADNIRYVRGNINKLRGKRSVLRKGDGTWVIGIAIAPLGKMTGIIRHSLYLHLCTCRQDNGICASAAVGIKCKGGTVG